MRISRCGVLQKLCVHQGVKSICSPALRVAHLLCGGEYCENVIRLGCVPDVLGCAFLLASTPTGE
jgi:hypothetical protein